MNEEQFTTALKKQLDDLAANFSTPAEIPKFHSGWQQQSPFLIAAVSLIIAATAGFATVNHTRREGVSRLDQGAPVDSLGLQGSWKIYSADGLGLLAGTLDFDDPIGIRWHRAGCKDVIFRYRLADSVDTNANPIQDDCTAKSSGDLRVTGPSELGRFLTRPIGVLSTDGGNKRLEADGQSINIEPVSGARPSEGSTQNARMPDVVGVEPIRARQMLSDAGIAFTEQTTESEDANNQRVVAVQPAPGATVKEGETIQIWTVELFTRG